MVYDERMLHHRNDVSANHPEVPERISRAWEGLVTRGLTSRCTLLEVRAKLCIVGTLHPIAFLC